MANDLQQKIKKLSAYYDAESIEILTAEEKRLRQKVVQSGLSENALVQSIVGDAKRQIENINFILSHKDGMETEERIKFFAMRRAHRFWVDRLSSAQSTAESVAEFEKRLDDMIAVETEARK